MSSFKTQKRKAKRNCEDTRREFTSRLSLNLKIIILGCFYDKKEQIASFSGAFLNILLGIISIKTFNFVPFWRNYLLNQFAKKFLLGRLLNLTLTKLWRIDSLILFYKLKLYAETSQKKSINSAFQINHLKSNQLLIHTKTNFELTTTWISNKWNF